MREEEFDFIIIGAGIAGLTCAKELSIGGKKVLVLEARNRPGGRMHTIDQQFSRPIDEGAEFVHGKAPLTHQLLKKAGDNLLPHNGKMYKYESGQLIEADGSVDDEGKAIRKLKQLKKDMAFSVFLNKTFKEKEDKELKKSLKRMVEGFDAADAKRISSFAVRDELTSGSMDESYKLKNGYSSVINYLYEDCIKLGCHIYLSSIVTNIYWKKQNVKVTCGEKIYKGKKLITTVPLGVLTAKSKQQGYLKFKPALPDKMKAARQMGFGGVVKIILEFKTTFWNNAALKNKITQVDAPGFLFCDLNFPTWWTQSPEMPIITGWAGGPNALKLNKSSDDAIFTLAIKNLSVLFSCEDSILHKQLVTFKVCNWVSDPFARGAYSYETLKTKKARKVLLKPEKNTLYFCGEALDMSGNMGTVEAAVSSAQRLVKKLLHKRY